MSKLFLIVMQKNINELRTKMHLDLLKAREVENDLIRLSETSKILDQAVLELNQFVEHYDFTDEEEEILFFKIIKPEFMSLRIEEVMRFNLLVNKPIGTIELQLGYYEEELKALQSFYRMNSFHYQYYRNGLNELDRVYFLRSAKRLTIPLADIAEYHQVYSTPLSFLFAKFIAFEHLQYFILEQIGDLKYPELKHTQGSPKPLSEMKWTGDTINVVELAYGIWLTGQVNNGNASLNQIVRWMESHLNVSIGIVQRRFTEIERRKRLSPTKYIDQMRDSIRRKIDDDLGNKSD